MSDVHSSYYPHLTAPAAAVKPPRPPNAWILFRAEESKKMPSGVGAPQQSEVSKTISARWKAASPQVRDKYERMAEQKKQEHARKYPDYRFQPVKKEDKERQKEAKKASRDASRGPSRRARSTVNRYAPYNADAAIHHASSSAPTPAAAPYYVDYSYHVGPTPPMSAASSPDSAEHNLPETPVESELPLSTPFVADSPPSNDALSHQNFDDFTLSSLPPWNYDTSQTIAPGFLTLDVAASALPDNIDWANSMAEFDGSLRDSVDTPNPSIFMLDNFDATRLDANPQSMLSLSVSDYAFDPTLFDNFDFSALPELGTFDRVYSDGSNAGSFDVEQYLNLEPAFSESSLIASEPVMPSPAPSEPSTIPQSYQPPTGAAFAGNRRVGGTWRMRPPSPDTSSPIPYGVRAS